MSTQTPGANPPPLVLCLSGHDPTGGAGLHADIEACVANGAHALSVITTNTVQDTRDVQRVVAVAPILLAQQIHALLDDCKIQAIKIGLLGDAQQIPVLCDLIRTAQVPVVCDPILRAGGGSNLVGVQVQAALLEQLLPLVTVLTPNAAEARRLVPRASSLDECAQTLIASGCSQVLITGGDEPDADVVNQWFPCEGEPRKFVSMRLSGSFHGAGCTLAAALAARLAQGEAMAVAIEAALSYTHQTLVAARAIGQGRKIPRRIL